MSNEDELVGTAEAARLLGLERSGFTRRVLSHRITLPVVMRGTGKNGEKFFRRSDVEALAASIAASTTSGDAA